MAKTFGKASQEAKESAQESGEDHIVYYDSEEGHEGYHVASESYYDQIADETMESQTIFDADGKESVA